MSKKLIDLNEIKSLEKELKNAIEQDDLYWVRNDAKLRAVQTSKTYEEFKNIVDAAHLRPITKKTKKSETEYN